MISEWLKNITIWFGNLGYWGVFIACLGLFPAEIVITMVGAVKKDSLIQIAVAASLGEMIGAYPMYFIGYYFRNRNILKFLNGKGKILNISEETYNREYETVKETGSIYILLSRLVPWLRIVVTLVSGYLKFNIILFSLAVFAGTFIYAYGFAYLGAKLGFNWSEIKRIIDTFNNSMFILLGIGVLIYVYFNRKKFFKTE